MIVSGAPDRLAADGDPPVLTGHLAVLLEFPVGGLVDHRTEPVLLLDRITDLDPSRLLDQLLGELLRDLFLDVHARTGAALLTLQPERRFHHPFGRHVEVGGGGDQGRVLAPHLRDARLRVVTGELAEDPEPDLLRSGEQDPVGAGVGDQLVPDGGAGTGDIVEDAVRQARLAVALGQPPAGEGRVARRLQNDGVPPQQGARRGPAGQSHREIERRDDHPDTVGTQNVEILLLFGEGLHRLFVSVVRLDLIAVVIHHVGGFLHIPHRLEPILADLDAEQSREIVAVLLDRVGRFAEVTDPLLPGHVTPGRLVSLPGRCDRLLRVVAGPFRKLTEDQTLIGRTGALESLAGGDLHTADEVRMCPPETFPDPLGGLVVRLGELGCLSGREGGVCPLRLG